MYKLVKENESSFKVVETATNTVVAEYASHGEANKHYRLLKSGAAFGGWTPSFVLRSVKHLINTET